MIAQQSTDLVIRDLVIRNQCRFRVPFPNLFLGGL